MRNILLPLGIVAVLLGCAGQTLASTLYNNLNEPTLTSYSIYTGGPLADSFSTGASTTLIDVEVLLELQGSAVGSVQVSLLANHTSDNDPSSPGFYLTSIGSIDDTSLYGGATPTVYTFTLTTPYALSADTRYWIELSSSDSSNANWAYDSDDSGVGVAGEYYYFYSGGTYSNTSGPYQMEVDASAISEPATITMLGISVATFACYGWWRRRQPVLA